MILVVDSGSTKTDWIAVNEFGETHDIKNLYVFDSSVFPTSSCVNPANTIQALALYFSEKLSERIKGKTLKNSSSNDRF